MTSPSDPSTRLGPERFAARRATAIARALVGMHLYTRFDRQLTGGTIVETEAYAHRGDAALDLHRTRRPQQSRALLGPGGRAYLYLVQGGNVLFNITAGPEGEANAVLVRVARPTVGLAVMERRGALPRSPGLLTRAFGLTVAANGLTLTAPGSQIWIEDHGARPRTIALPRIGLAYAGAEAAGLPWRFRAVP